MEYFTGSFIGSFIALLVASWVYLDAKKRGKNSISAFWWFLGTWLLLIVFLPIWLTTRPKPSGGAPITTTTQLCSNCSKYYESNQACCPYCGYELEERLETFEDSVILENHTDKSQDSGNDVILIEGESTVYKFNQEEKKSLYILIFAGFAIVLAIIAVLITLF